MYFILIPEYPVPKCSTTKILIVPNLTGFKSEKKTKKQVDSNKLKQQLKDFKQGNLWGIVNIF